MIERRPPSTTPAREARPRSRWRSTLSGPRVAPWVFISPFFAFLIAFTVIPTIYAVVMSLHSDNTGAFTGLQNYATVLQDPDFRDSVGVIWQAIYTLVPLFIVAGVSLALLLDGKAGWGKEWAKLFMFLPLALPATVSTIIWAFNYSPDASVLGGPLRLAGMHSVLDLARPAVRPYAIMNIVLWQNVGGWVVVLTASLAGIPAELIEMARIEGANAWALALRIKLPLIAPVLVLMVVSVTSYVLTLITEPYLLQGVLQVPATYTPNMWAYSASFSGGVIDVAAAAAVLMLLVSAVFAVAFVLRSGVHRTQD